MSRYILIAILIVCAQANAQTISVRTDRNQILIGERIEYLLSFSSPDAQHKIEVKFPDSIPHFDVLLNEGLISGTNPQQYKVLLTSFDSGSWFIPSLPVAITTNGSVQLLRTDSVLINVDYSAADSTDALRDIKPILEVEVKDYFWWYIAAAIISLLLILLLVNDYLRRRRQRPTPVFHQSVSAYDEAMSSIKKLDAIDISTEAGTRLFHTALGDIFRKYYSRTIQKDVMNNTTGDMLLLLKGSSASSQLISDLATALRVTDAVKFAKYMPSEELTSKTKQGIKKLIDDIEAQQKMTDPKTT